MIHCKRYKSDEYKMSTNRWHEKFLTGFISSMVIFIKISQAELSVKKKKSIQCSGLGAQVKS